MRIAPKSWGKDKNDDDDDDDDDHNNNNNNNYNSDINTRQKSSKKWKPLKLCILHWNVLEVFSG